MCHLDLSAAATGAGPTLKSDSGAVRAPRGEEEWQAPPAATQPPPSSHPWRPNKKAFHLLSGSSRPLPAPPGADHPVLNLWGLVCFGGLSGPASGSRPGLVKAALAPVRMCRPITIP